MRLVPIVYVTDMDRSTDFFEALGANVAGERNPYWTELDLGSSHFALHISGPMEPGPQRVGISLSADRRLEDIVADLDAAGVGLARGIADETFGRSMVIQDPDGLTIQINEHD